MKIEYRVRPVTRYIVTRFHDGSNGAGVDTAGEFDSRRRANGVAAALAEHEARFPPPDVETAVCYTLLDEENGNADMVVL